MNARELTTLLVEKLADAEIDPKTMVFANRLMLRLFTQPSLMANLVDVNVYKPEHQPEEGQSVEKSGTEAEKGKSQDRSGTVLMQLVFRRLPQEIISPLIRLIAAPREPKLYRFIHHGQARLGVELDLRPSDFPEDEYSAAY